jgi:hypothetical protein
MHEHDIYVCVRAHGGLLYLNYNLIVYVLIPVLNYN